MASRPVITLQPTPATHRERLTAPAETHRDTTPTPDDWYTDIGDSLEHYERMLARTKQPVLTDSELNFRMTSLSMAHEGLLKLGITVCGDFGHA